MKSIYQRAWARRLWALMLCLLLAMAMLPSPAALGEAADVPKSGTVDEAVDASESVDLPKSDIPKSSAVDEAVGLSEDFDLAKAAAADPNTAPDEGSLRVVMKQSIYKRLPKPVEVEFTLYQIGVAAPESAAGWKINDDLSSYRILEASTAEELGKAAKALAKDIGKSYKGTTLVTSEDSVTFSRLGTGVYLGAMTSGPEGLSVKPFIATVPARDPETGELRYAYDVNVKIAYSAGPTPEPSATPNVPDDDDDTPTTEISGVKIWVDDEDLHGLRPEDITVQLYANGELLGNTPTWRDKDSDNWHYTFGRLPALDEDGEAIEYTVKELPVDDYTTNIAGTTITNTLIPRQTKKFVDLAGTKTWNDNNNARGRRPRSITVHLLRDGVAVASAEATGGGNWKYSFEHQPADDGFGHEYTYTIHEDAVPGYYGRVENDMDLVNTLITGYDFTGRTTTGGGDVAKGRNTPSYTPPFEDYSESELAELFDLFDYNTPLWGMLTTGDETPTWPYVAGGIGFLALAALVIMSMKRKKN